MLTIQLKRINTSIKGFKPMMINASIQKGFFMGLLLVLINLASCSGKTKDDVDVIIQLHPEITYQTIHSFGASDAWSCQFVGKHWPLEKKQQMAEWLFSSDLHPDGSPKGIGLTCWRFNIGAGSAYQTKDKGIKDRWRRAESFLREDGFNPEAQQGQRWFLRQASKYGVTNLIGFVNSPPVLLTKNGKAYSAGGVESNIAKENYAEYAEFLCGVHAFLQETDKVKLNHLSPINEPQWDWKNGQEGSPWTNTEMAVFTRILDAEISKRKIDAKIELTEAAKLNYLFENADKPQRGHQIVDFWNPNSTNYIGNLTHVSNTVAAHSYFTTFPDSALIETRRKVRKEIERYPQLEFGMSEYCMLENNTKIKGHGKGLGMDAALYMAKVIHADLVEANSNTWQWWLAISPYNYKDGLIYIDKDSINGAYTDSKLLWTLGNYSRFIPPGSLRIGLNIIEGHENITYNDGLLISAFKSKTQIIVVIVNQSSKKVTIKTSNDYPTKRTFVTNDTSNLEAKRTTSQITAAPEKSITTLVIDY